MTINVFVYGTLMKGHRLSPVMDTAKIGPLKGILKGYRRIWPEGNFPVIVVSPGDEVVGEIYNIPNELLDELDDIECIPRLYVRIPVEVVMDESHVPTNYKVQCQTYYPSSDTLDCWLSMERSEVSASS